MSEASPIKYYRQYTIEDRRQITAPAEFYCVNEWDPSNSYGVVADVSVDEVTEETEANLRRRLEEAARKMKKIYGCGNPEFYRFYSKTEETRGNVFGFANKENPAQPFATNETGYVTRWVRYTRRPTNDPNGQVVLETTVLTRVKKERGENPEVTAQRFAQKARNQVGVGDSGYFYNIWTEFRDFKDWVPAGLITFHPEETQTFQKALNPQPTERLWGCGL